MKYFPISQFHESLAREEKLIYSGRIDIDQKGLDILIEAFARLAVINPELELVLMGPDWDGSIARLKQLSVRLGVSTKECILQVIWKEKNICKI